MKDRSISPQVEQLLERIDDRLTGKESLELEFKTAAGRLPTSLWSTASAFANTSGGWIVLGVDENVQPIELTGVGNPDKLLQDFYNLVRNPQKISTEVCGPNDVKIESIDGRDAIVIWVRPAPRKQRPVFVDNDLLHGSYVRRHSGDAHCSLAEVERMIREKSDVSADSTVLSSFGMDDLDRDALRRYRQRFLLANPEDLRNGLSDVEFLRGITGLRKDRDTGNEGLTVAGVLMFGREESLREWRGRHHIDFRLLPVLSRPAEWDDRVLWEGCLFGAFETIAPRLGVALKTPLRFEGGVRVDDTPAHKAIREALVNLLVHADYTERVSSQVFCSPDGFQFLNPGNSRVPVEDLAVGHHSDARNPNLGFMFRMVNLAEEAGSGIPRIFASWAALGYRRPVINTSTDRYEFLLEMRHAHLIGDDDREWLQTVDSGLSEAEQLALLAALHEGEVDNARLRSATGMHPADATKALRGLKERGLLTMSGWARGAYYHLGPEAPANPHMTHGYPGAGLQPPGLEASNAGSNATSSGGNDAYVTSSNPSLSRLDGKVTSSSPSLSPGDPTVTSSDQQETLDQIAGAARLQHRLPPADLQHVILQLCAIQPLTLRELATLLDRSRQRLLPHVHALEAAGKLRPMHPQRRHPQQRYTAVVPDQ